MEHPREVGMSRWAVLVAAAAAACAESPDGALHGIGDAVSALGERPVAGGTVWVGSAGGAVMAGLEVVSDDPGVVEAVAPADLLDDPSRTEDALSVDASGERTWLVLRAGDPGTAVLSLVDPDNGEVVDTVEVEVAAVDHQELRPAWAWHVDRPLPARVLAGVPHQLARVRVDAAGRALAGELVDEAPLSLPASPPGHLELDGLPVEVVAPADVVGLELLPARSAQGHQGLLLVGRDAAGDAVLGLPAAWDGARDPAAVGDVLAYLPGSGHQPVAARFGDHVVEGVVATDHPTEVLWSDVPAGCSTTGAGAGAAAALVAAAVARRRRLLASSARERSSLARNVLPGRGAPRREDCAE
jgi:hypothetical protein